MKESVRFGKRAVFDVGANRGQTYIHLRSWFPDAPVYCFEPAKETFEKLKQTVGDDARAEAHQVALASKSGRAGFTTGLGTGNHIVKSDTDSAQEKTEVEMLTGDQFCQRHDISEIDFLKIDTEGYDLDVLLGFADMLRHGCIDFIQVECSPNLDNRFHVHLERFIHFLHPFNYRLCHLIEPVRRVHKTDQELRGIWYCNAVFAREVDAPRLRRDGNN